MEPVENITNFVDCADDDAKGPRRGVFTPGEILKVFNANFLDYEFARLWILKRLHPHGAHCPGCGAAVPAKKLRRFWANGRIRCGECGKYYTALTGTFISGCQIDFRGLMLLSVLIALGVHDGQIAAIVGMGHENVRLWRLRFEKVKQ